MTVATTIEPEGRAKRLKRASTAIHEQVDQTVMASAPFASRENYARFLRFQHRLHQRVEPLYADPALQGVLTDLADRSRLDAVERDLADLGLTKPAASEAGPSLPLPEAAGWLYVVEGSNMGAAFLLKAAGNIGLTEDFGARHLAGHAEGRGLHWRRFTAALDALEMSPEEDARALEAAHQAFAYVLAVIADEVPVR